MEAVDSLVEAHGGPEAATQHMNDMASPMQRFDQMIEHSKFVEAGCVISMQSRGHAFWAHRMVQTAMLLEGI